MSQVEANLFQPLAPDQMSFLDIGTAYKGYRQKLMIEYQESPLAHPRPVPIFDCYRKDSFVSDTDLHFDQDGRWFRRTGEQDYEELGNSAPADVLEYLRPKLNEAAQRTYTVEQAFGILAFSMQAKFLEMDLEMSDYIEL